MNRRLRISLSLILINEEAAYCIFSVGGDGGDNDLARQKTDVILDISLHIVISHDMTCTKKFVSSESYPRAKRGIPGIRCH